MKYISMDIETTGLKHDWCQTLSIGAIYDDLANKHVIINQLPRFECIVRWPRILGEPYALWLNQWILEILAQNVDNYKLACQTTGKHSIPILKPEMVMPAFMEWLKGLGLDKVKMNYTGKNFASFDKQFLDNNFGFTTVLMGSGLRMAHRFFDAGSVYFCPGVDDGVPSTDDIIKKCNEGKPVESQPITTADRHDHLGDACRVIQLIRHYYDLTYEGWFSRYIADS